MFINNSRWLFQDLHPSVPIPLPGRDLITLECLPTFQGRRHLTVLTLVFLSNRREHLSHLLGTSTSGSGDGLLMTFACCFEERVTFKMGLWIILSLQESSRTVALVENSPVFLLTDKLWRPWWTLCVLKFLKQVLLIFIFFCFDNSHSAGCSWTCHAAKDDFELSTFYLYLLYIRVTGICHRAWFTRC